MRVLSLFDGISALMQALSNMGINVDSYHASEIDKYAIKVSKDNFPSIQHIGDVKSVDGRKYDGIDLLCGGSPCQDLSKAKHKRRGLKGTKSSLFWEYVRVKNEAKPDFFIFENVASMTSKDRDTITNALGVSPILLNSANFSAQRRSRLFWCNFRIDQPNLINKEKLQDFLENGVALREKAYCCTASYSRCSNSIEREGNSRNLVYMGNGKYRKLAPVEFERLQKFPDGYTSSVSNSQRYKCLGNSFTVSVIEYILGFMDRNNSRTSIGKQLEFSV